MIYLDNHATTECDPRVVEEMMPYFTIIYGNPASGHNFGSKAAEAIDTALFRIGDLLKCRPEEITITSGATESNNIILLGVTFGKLALPGKRNKIVTTEIEHKAVLAPIAGLVKEGWRVEYLPLDHLGRIDLEKADQIINDETYLVSVQLANSEIGTIQPIAALTDISRRNGAFTHCDASQAIGKVPVGVDQLGIDFLSLSGHKIYGPKGIGALWIRDGLKKLVHPIMFGGGSDSNIRPGTLPVPLIVGLGSACKLMNDGFDQESARLFQLRNKFEQALQDAIPGLTINGDLNNRLYNNSNLTFPSIDAEMLLANLPELILSTGSACESGSIEPSRVLTAIGITPDNAYNTIRVGLGRFNDENEVDTAALMITAAYFMLSEVLGV